MHLVTFLSLIRLGAGPVFLEDRFEAPAGFRIYRAAGNDLSGGSYDIALDAEGRLLVGDGTQVRRLTDGDGDGVFDRFEVLCGGLGSRGPQGLLLLGDRLFAVGGDGIQLFDGYLSGGPLTHRGRIGQPFRTGGDHDAHTILQGHDGFLYFITGDGGGTRDRLHITEETSPALFERSCSVFRISPDGKRWECIGSGGRNSPNVGMNYLGELFSFDSDMEWHVDLPWWRPVRLHHWTAGGDQGWQDVGAYPPYYIDNLPGAVDVGRGSPDWGVFYEHAALPEKYRDAYLVCDYPSKSATTGGYVTAGQLYAFHLERRGAGWKAAVEVMLRPKPGAKDAAGSSVQFALVDIEVAPDGSFFLSDHNQGIWRVLFDPDRRAGADRAPSWAPSWPVLPSEPAKLLDVALAVPQLGTEWGRTRLAAVRKVLGQNWLPLLQAAASDRKRPLRARLGALRLLAADFAEMSIGLLTNLSFEGSPELRGQVAWLWGLRGGESDRNGLFKLLIDRDPFVRRRVAEAFARRPAAEAAPGLINLLRDPDRLVRYVAMTAIAHLPPASWLDKALAEKDAQVRMRALIAVKLRREEPPAEAVRSVVVDLLARASPGDSNEHQLDLLRILGLFRRVLSEDEAARAAIERRLLGGFPSSDRDVRWEEARLIGEYRLAGGFAKVLAALEGEKDPVTQFHLAQSLARLREGWTPAEEERAIAWFIGVQKGWFAEFSGKGLQFREFWGTVLSEFAQAHREAFLKHIGEIEWDGLLGGAAVDALAESKRPAESLIALYRAMEDDEARRRIAAGLGRSEDPAAGELLRQEFERNAGAEMRGAILRALARSPRRDARNAAILLEGLLHPDRETAANCAQALAGYTLNVTESTAGILIGRLAERENIFHAVERLLVRATGKERPGYRADVQDRRRPERGERAEREASVAFWTEWYADKFGKPFRIEATRDPRELSDEDLRRFLLEREIAGGDAGRGLAIYEAARCGTCHGGGAVKVERIFGPDLAGATRRLSREELADSLVYPSKVVADRFKAMVVQVRGQIPLTGFITEQDEEKVTVATQEGIHRIPRAKIAVLAPQATSLMPERLLNRLSTEEIRDLYAYLETLGAGETPRD